VALRGLTGTGTSPTVGQEWARTLTACQDQYGGMSLDLTGDAYGERQAFLHCAAEVEWTRARITLGGAASAALVAVGILVVAQWFVRRARGLRELGPRLEGASDRFRSLADEAGLVTRDTSLLAGYAWRAVLLAMVVALGTTNSTSSPTT